MLAPTPGQFRSSLIPSPVTAGEPSVDQPSLAPISSLSRRPAITASVLFILGIFAHRALAPVPILWLNVAISAALLSLALLRHQFASTFALSVAIFCIAVASAQRAGYFYPRTDISQFTTEEPRIVHLELRITDPPRLVTTSSLFRKNEHRQVTRGEVTRILTPIGWKPATGTVPLSLTEPLQNLRINATVRITGLLHRPTPAANPGQFDWAGYYRDDRILAACSIPKSSAVTILSDPGPDFLDQLRAKSRSLLAEGFSKEKSLDHALLRALVLGDTDPELRDVQEDFRRTGTSHHLAISGMHVTILGAILYYILLIFRLHPRTSLAITLVFVLVYGCVVLPSPPVVRSIILCLVFVVGIFFRRRTDHVHLLALTALVMLAYHPMDLYNAGFQLSFGTVLGLMVFTRPFRERFFKSDRDEEVVLALLGHRAPRALRFKRWFHDRYAEAFSVGIVAWLISFPLIMHHFEQLNPWSILSSLLLAVFVLFALIGGFAKLILTLLVPSLAATWAAGAGFLIALMRHTLELLAKFPGSDLPLPSFGIAAVVIYYTLLFFFFKLPRPILPAGYLKRFITAAAACIVGLIPFFGAIHSSDSEHLKLTTLSLGAGLCNVIELPDGNTVLIDAGSSTVTDLHRKILAPFLRHEGRRNIDCLFLSHRDYDHISAAAEAVEACGVRRVFVSDPFEHFARESAPARELVDNLRRQARIPKPLRTGDLVPLSRGAIVEVVWPPQDSTFDSNDTGLVLRLTYAGKSILFPADIQGPAEIELLKHPEKLKSDILLAPHHGSAEPTTAAFLEAVHPQFIISSNDSTLTQKQKRFSTLAQRYKLLGTDSSGAVTVTISKTGQLNVTTFLHH
jgi:competence protein ComEC